MLPGGNRMCRTKGRQTINFAMLNPTVVHAAFNAAPLLFLIIMDAGESVVQKKNNMKILRPEGLVDGLLLSQRSKSRLKMLRVTEG